MAELKDSGGSNNRGLRGMTYSRYGGNLITFGFETYMNGYFFFCIINLDFANLIFNIYLKFFYKIKKKVYCPEISLTRCFIGKLVGHSHIIVSCKFI